MTKEKSKKLLCVDDIRYTEYYGLQETFDTLYAKSQAGEEFTDLMDIILSRENILLAYRSIKSNAGSNTPGTDRLTIKDIGKLSPDEVVANVNFIVTGSVHGYRPKPVRRKDIPKPNGSTRPLGIPCIWDRLVQQCIKQVMEPICEAKFSENSFGFRPNRSVENAIQRTYYRLQKSNAYYVVEFDIKGFFDNVNHSKLIRQIWALGIHDKHLIYVLRRILTAPIKMPDGTLHYPKKGTPQGGIISPLLANIVLNELDHWIDSQWQKNPVARKYKIGHNKQGKEILSSGYNAMRGTNLKEMYIVRYADDFRIFCKTKNQAERVKVAVSKWLSERLKLEVSTEKTRVVNAKRKSSEFLGFEIKLRRKGQKYVVESHIGKKQINRLKNKLKSQAKVVAKPPVWSSGQREAQRYNLIVMGAQNYYQIATHVNIDCRTIHREVMTVFTNRLRGQKGYRLTKKGRELTPVEKDRYGKSKMLRYLAGSGEPIYPIAYIQCKKPMARKSGTCRYTPEGRKGLHENLGVNTRLMRSIMRQRLNGRSIEYMDNRISLFSGQYGKCAVTGKVFQSLDDIHCHHKIPLNLGGTDAYSNLVLVLNPIHKLIHATDPKILDEYMSRLELGHEQLQKINKYRELANLPKIA